MLACSTDAMEAFVVSATTAMGAPGEVADEVARHLVRAELSGHGSHGVVRLAQYVDEAQRGDLVPQAMPSVELQRGGLLLLDANRGFGHFSARVALDECMDRVKEVAIAAAAIRHCTHIGRLGDYAELAAERGLITIMAVGVAGEDTGGAAPYGARTRFLGTNPWCFGVPTGDGAPVVVDMATTSLAGGRIHVAAAKGEQLPNGAIIDRDGRPSTDPDDYYAGGAFQPAAGHKGYGLGLVGALIGAVAMIGDPAPTAAGTSSRGAGDLAPGSLGGAFLAVVDPAALGPLSGYEGLVSEAARQLRDLTPAPGFDRVRVPGDPEREARESAQNTVRLTPSVAERLEGVAERLGIDVPWAASPTRANRLQ